MFLNGFGQPLILNSKKTYGPYEQHNGPILLTSAAFQDHVIPIKWCRHVVGSADDVARFKESQAEPSQEYVYTVLKPNEPTPIEYESETKIILTLIPAGQNNDGESVNLYYLKTKYSSALITDKLTEYLDFIPKAGESFHRVLGIGIDVVYIDDLCYMSEDEEALTQRENIYAFVQLIRPKFVYGLRQENVHKSLRDLCVLNDEYALPPTVRL